MNAERVFAECIDLLEAGEWARGMKLYRRRYHPKRTNITKVKFPKLPLPFIEGASIDAFKGKKVLVLNEQGFGDELMFFRSIYLLLEVVSALAWQAYPETAELLKLNVPEEVQVLTSRTLSAEYLKQFDCYTSTGSLFSMLGAEQPLPLRYVLQVGVEQDLIPNSVGVCWATNPKSPNGASRSLDIDILKPAIDDADVYSLTRDADAPPWIKPCPNFKDFLETARLMRRLTHIVTVDTSIAHLAGSLGKSTFLVIKEHHDWRWRYLDTHGHSLLYPTIRVVTLSEILALLT